MMLPILQTNNMDSQAPQKPLRQPEEPENETMISITFDQSTVSSEANENIRILPKGSALPGLKRKEQNILREKQCKLSSTTGEIAKNLPDRALQTALASTLIFAQYEAGTAVCIDETGWILTCAHCFGDSESELLAFKKKWLLFFTGEAVQVECVVWDFRRDLSLCKIVAVESDRGLAGQIPCFKHLKLSERSPKLRQTVYCIGQPGRDDLESISARKTLYNLIEISQGRFRGLVSGVDPQDNSEIGCFKHDAWTYWGHSGAPLVEGPEMTLSGIHWSWDDETGMRHGVPWIAIKAFLDENLQNQKDLRQQGNSSSQSRVTKAMRSNSAAIRAEKQIPVIVIDEDDDDKNA